MSAAAERMLSGVGASPGITIGRALAVARRPLSVAFRQVEGEGEREREVARLEAAIAATERELTSARDQLAQPDSSEYRHILEAHLLILRDRLISERSKDFIRQQGVNAEWALTQAVGEAKIAFDRVEDPYLRSRFSDVEYVTDQLLRHLTGHQEESLSRSEEQDWWTHLSRPTTTDGPGMCHGLSVTDPGRPPAPAPHARAKASGGGGAQQHKWWPSPEFSIRGTQG